MNATVALTYAMLAAQTLGVGHVGVACSRWRDRKQGCPEVGRYPGQDLGVVMLGYPDVKYHRAPSRRPLKVREDK